MKSHEVTLLGCHIDRELKLNDHVSNNCTTAGKKQNNNNVMQHPSFSQEKTINEGFH